MLLPLLPARNLNIEHDMQLPDDVTARGELSLQTKLSRSQHLKLNMVVLRVV